MSAFFFIFKGYFFTSFSSPAIMAPLILILTRKFLVNPEKLLAFVHHADETAEARVFGFEQGVEFAQG